MTSLRDHSPLPHSRPLQEAAGPIAIVLGMFVIYVVWGSTYLAIKFGIATIPPFLMAGTRFFVAGIILYSW
ncbi:MAG: EamA family transporter, partial [Planctomycetota bacterium]|nr:EamA family transporter [Planctomycetota bacterium]